MPDQVADQVTTPVRMLVIHATMPKVAATESLVSFRRKDTAKNPVAEADKFRGVLVVPPYQLPQTSEALHEVFAEAISEAFFSAAGDILREYCDTNKDAKEVEASRFTFENVLTKMSEAQSSTRLNGEQITNWFDGSKTSEEAIKRYGSKDDKKYNVLREKYASLASNNPGGINPQLAQKMLSYLSPEDADNAVMKAIAKKLEKLSVEVVDEL